MAPRFRLKDPALQEAAPAARALNAWLELRSVVPSVTPALDDVVAALNAA